jgi:hypothetical protein
LRNDCTLTLLQCGEPRGKTRDQPKGIGVQHETRGVVGGLALSAMILGVIATLEPSARLLQPPAPLVSASTRFFLTDQAALIAPRPRPPLRRPRIPSESREWH